MSENVGALYRASARSEETAVVDFPEFPHSSEGRRTSYAALHAATSAIARGLLRRGIGRGDRVAVCAANRVEYITLVFAIMQVGAIAVPVNTQLPARAVGALCEDAGARLLFTDASCRHRRPAALPSVDIDSEELAAFLDPGPFEAVETTADTLALLLYTSGSTGTPKGVLHDHAALAWLTSAVTSVRELTADDRCVAAAPLYHMAAYLTMFTTLAAGATLVLLPKFDIALFGACLKQYRPTLLTGVPTVWSSVMSNPDVLDGVDVSAVRAVFVGSMAAPRRLLDDLATKFARAKVLIGYGLTEVAAVFRPGPTGARKRRSLGVPLPGVSVKLLDAQGREADEGTLWVKCRGVMKGYHGRPEETAARLKDGWLDTRDVCRRDETGAYHFVRRADDMFKSAGRSIYPTEIQVKLEDHPGIAAAAVVAIPHETKGHVPVAFVVARPGAALAESEVKEWFMTVGAPYQHPRRVFVVDALPVNDTRKVDNKALLELALRYSQAPDNDDETARPQARRAK